MVNTNDPDYEHIYSVESYNDHVDELLYTASSDSDSDGAVFALVSRATPQLLRYFPPLCFSAELLELTAPVFLSVLAGGTLQESDKTAHTMPAGQKAFKASSKSGRSTRPKRSASGKGKLSLALASRWGGIPSRSGRMPRSAQKAWLELPNEAFQSLR